MIKTKLEPFLSAFALISVLLLGLSGGFFVTPEFVHQSDAGGLLDRYQILAPDDVMITMRVAQFFAAHGYPGFNETDLSQPATSYLLPIVLSPAFKFLEPNAGVAVAIIAGALLYVISVLLIVHQTRDFFAKLFIASVALLNSTASAYLFSGWEHLWACFFVVVCWLLCWPKVGVQTKVTRLIGAGVCAALAVLARPDSLLLVAPAIAFVLVCHRSRALYAIVPFVLIGASYAALQFSWFGWFTPTTARLKAGQLPGFWYSSKYLVKLILTGSAAGFIAPFIFASVSRQKFAITRPQLYAVGAIVLFCGYAIAVSDVFKYGRFFLPALGLALLVFAKALQELPWAWGMRDRYAVVVVSALLASPIVLSHILQNMRENISPRTMEVRRTPEAEHALLSRYIGLKLDKSDGAIGLFYLGVASFNLQNFEVADFLGKADEAVARTERKWGPPGHDKWSAKVSIEKWDPAVVIMHSSFAGLTEPRPDGALLRRRDFAFWEDFAITLNRRGYIFCKPYPDMTFGLLVRPDLAGRIENCGSAT